MTELHETICYQFREDRYRIFRLLSRSVDLTTRFMVPNEQGRADLGNDGSVHVGREALKRLVERSGTAMKQ